MIGRNIPYANFGYSSTVRFLSDLSDVVRINRSGNDYHLMCVADESTKHIVKMVAKQKAPKHKPTTRPKTTRYVYTNSVEKQRLPRFQRSSAPSNKVLPSSIETEIVHLLLRNSLGLRLGEFLTSYRTYYGRELLFKDHGFYTLQECLESISSIILKPLDNDVLIKYSSAPEETYFVTVDQNTNSRKTFKSTSLPVANTTQSTFDQSRQISNNYTDKCASTASSKLSHFNTPTRLDSSSPINTFGACASSVRNSKKPFFNDQDSDPTYGHFKPNPWSKFRFNGNEKVQNLLDLNLNANNSGLCEKNVNESHVSEKIKDNLRKIIGTYRHGIWAKEFPAIYQEITNTEFDLHSLRFYDMASFVDAVPEILARKSTVGSKKDWIILPADKVDEFDVSNPKSASLMIESIIASTRKILQAYPEGIPLSEFLHVYCLNCTEPLLLEELGFDCIEHLLICIEDRVPLEIKKIEDRKFVCFVQSQKKFSPSSPKHEPLPEKAVSPSSEYVQQAIPDNLNYQHSSISVYIAEVNDPNHFYFQIIGPTTSDTLKSLYDDMETFYNKYEHKYRMNFKHISIGIRCVAKWPKDCLWYRVRVIALPSPEVVKVIYVDYGTVSDLKYSDLRYLCAEFANFPAQALKGSLVDIEPPNNNVSWSIQASNRFLKMISDISLVASVTDIVNDVYYMRLWNTNSTNNININLSSVLVKEGLAKNKPPHPESNTQTATATTPTASKDGNKTVVTFFEKFVEAFKVNTTQKSENLPTILLEQLTKVIETSMNQQQGAISPPVENLVETASPSNSDSSPIDIDSDGEIFDADDDAFFEELYQNTVTRQYIKSIRTKDWYEFNVLIYQNELFISGGDIAGLIWSDKDSDYFLQRVQNSEVDFKFINVTENENLELFRQVKNSSVKGLKKVMDKECLVIAPLKTLIPILNLFGHPSVELRLMIRKIIKDFSPFLCAWMGTSSTETEDIEAGGRPETDDDKVNRLNLCQLQTMKAGICLRRSKLKEDLREIFQRRKLNYSLFLCKKLKAAVICFLLMYIMNLERYFFL
ncbi:tudor domain-containing protein 5 [Caerostris darwini]|uniref:Tudor domain-containing protein 5 n=1 Tax=Caerostris darwini TaxID=1538125 RepID=A0AAV4UFB2_9ARAC|nr:tudor domain-containing protein 5 [Caerostris darwini]